MNKTYRGISTSPDGNLVMNFTDDKLYKDFKDEYQKAVASKADSFTFRSKGLDVGILLTVYAKYVLEYIEPMRTNKKLRFYDAEKRKWKKTF